VDHDPHSSDHQLSIQQQLSLTSSSDKQAAAPLTKGDLLIVVFVSTLWLWAAAWAMISAALR
jgi:hypothetical protein